MEGNRNRRRIDDLGRVVVPRNQKGHGDQEADPLGDVTDRRWIILKKYSPICRTVCICKAVCGKSIRQVLRCLVGICDMDQVVLDMGNGKKIQDEDITGELGEFLERTRKNTDATAGKRYVPIIGVSGAL